MGADCAVLASAVHKEAGDLAPTCAKSSMCRRRLADVAKDFPPQQAVYWLFRRFIRRFLFETIHDMALMIDCEQAAREASLSAAVVDSQSVKAQARGYDAGKKIIGRNRPSPSIRTATHD